MDKQKFYKGFGFGFLILFLFGFSYGLSQTLDYGQCQTFLIYNTTSNSSKPYYEETICAKSFPMINKNVVLDENNTLFVLPNYNFSVRISSSIFQQQLSQVLQNQKSIADLQKQIADLQSSINGLNKNVNSQIASVRNETQNQTTSLKSEITQLQFATKNKGSNNSTLYIAGILLLAMGVGYLAFKFGWIKPPRHQIEEYETIEPRVQELRKKRKKKKG